MRNGGFFFKKHTRRWENSAKPFLLCLENPHDPTIDIGKSAYNIKRVVRAFQHAHDHILYNSSQDESILGGLIKDIPELPTLLDE